MTRARDLADSADKDIAGTLTLDDLTTSGNVTVGGNLSVTGTTTGGGGSSGTHTGDVVGNVTGNLTGNVTGDVTGDVTGNLTGNVTGDLTGNLTGNSNVAGNLIAKGYLASEATNSTNKWLAYTHTDNTLRLNYNGAGADEVTIDSGGTLAVGTSDTHTWSTFDGRIRVGARGCIATTSGSTQVGHNWYYNGGYKYIGTGHATRMVQTDDGYISFENAPSGSADAAITFTERARITPSGGITFNGDTAAANALNSYEEGAWTPTANNGSFTGLIHGRYTKVGNKVTAWAYIQGIDDTSTSSLLEVGGLPYAAVAGGSLSSTSGSIMLRYLDVGVTDEMGVIVFLSGGSTALRIYVLQAGGTYTAVQNAHFSNGAIGFRLQITYQV